MSVCAYIHMYVYLLLPHRTLYIKQGFSIKSCEMYLKKHTIMNVNKLKFLIRSSQNLNVFIHRFKIFKANTLPV